jgi:hypothetical protein
MADPLEGANYVQIEALEVLWQPGFLASDSGPEV